ncbi:hypothetical protein [Egicoccus halophilus]|uniref:Uncharacterized protein n=1 Tax=Egicoccus halophilus TaxID=1670830 RepID=A0A8J3EVX3_9ACTN|nr:hypothetical protein [Egicoccus halophilus]GGI09036.1 hypothetical protein GCM10011354_32070 [Egicoccus halophilus]
MPNRTLTEARQALADLAPSLNPEMYRRLEDELKTAQRQARRYADNFLASNLATVEERRATLLVEACQVRDELDALEAEGAGGLISAADYAEQLQALEARRTQVDNAYSETVRELDGVETVEDDPDAWLDGVFRRYPKLMPAFTF